MKNFSELNISKSDTGLIPAIIQDNSTMRVLMLGYMNAEAYEKTVTEGRVTFFSRSRGKLWTKGETSGNHLYVKSISVDCDSDTLLIRVDAAGPTCHTGTQSCFAGRDSEGFIGRLASIISERHKLMPEDSYTTKLFSKGVSKIAQKVGEEAVETVIEAMKGDNERLIYEVGDLIYHLLVLLENQGLTLADIEQELSARHK